MNAPDHSAKGSIGGASPRRDAAYALAEHAVSTRYEDIPADALEVTKKDILDVVAVTVAGSSVGLGCREIVELVKESGGREEATILGYGGKVPAWMAAFANGSMAHALDYDDTLDDGATHIGAGTIPAAMAMAERIGGVSGKQLMTAVACGLDMGGRIAMSAQPKGIIVGTWVMPMIGGYFSGTAAAGRILGLDVAQMVNAFGLAYSQCSGAFEIIWGVGSLKGVYPAYPGKSSVLAALMAQRGVAGPKDTLEGKAGLMPLYYGGQYDPEVLTQDLGSKYYGTGMSFKPWPCCRWSHTSVGVVMGLMKDHQINASEVEEVIVHTNHVSQPLFEPLDVRQNPTNLTEAQFSLPYILGALIAKGRLGIGVFTDEGRKDAEIARMAKRIVSRSGPPTPGRNFAIKVEIRTPRGVFSREDDRAYGHPEKPISMDDLVKKAQDCFEYAVKPIPRARANEVIDRLVNLEREKDVGGLIALMA